LKVVITTSVASLKALSFSSDKATLLAMTV